MKMTNKEYIQSVGCFCPHCESNALDCALPEMDHDAITVGVKCCNCDEEWQDVYTLTDIVHK